MASSIKELHCSDCLFFRHNIQAKPYIPINECSLNNISEYRKTKLAHGDDLTMCDNGRTEIENKLLSKGW